MSQLGIATCIVEGLFGGLAGGERCGARVPTIIDDIVFAVTQMVAREKLRACSQEAPKPITTSVV